MPLTHPLLTGIRETVSSEPDGPARKEVKIYYDDAKGRSDIKKAFYSYFVVFVRIMFVLIILVASIRVLHLVLPDYSSHYLIRQWLTPEQIQGIDKLLFSGAIGGLLTSNFKKALGTGQ